MKAYKGFKNDMTCRDFQYEEGKEYHEERALCCDTGFHACEYPLDCFKYYEPADSVYHEVEQTGDIDKSECDSKVASTEIKIGAKIGIPGLVQAAIEYTSKRCEKKAENHNTGYCGASSNTGNRGASSNTGDWGASSNTGYRGSFEETVSLLRRKVVDQRLQNGLYELSEALEIIRATTEEIKAAIERKGGHHDI